MQSEATVYLHFAAHIVSLKGGGKMKRLVFLAARSLPLVLCIALLGWMGTNLTDTQWLAFGEQTAVLALGLQSPREGALYIEQQLSAAVETQTSPTWPASQAASAFVETGTVIPPKSDGGGAVTEEQIRGGTVAAGAVTVKNKSGVSFDFAALLQRGLSFEPTGTEEPQVLIVHTHATECYMSYYAGYYNADDATRSTDNQQNVVAVGEVIAQELRAGGIGVLHDTTQHDSPNYTGAYDRSAQTIESYLAQYPSIRVVLDIHRDAMMYEDLTKVKPTVTVDGQKAAQMMVVVGGTNTAELPNAYCEENLAFGLQLHQTLETAHPGLMRPLYLVDARYNQGLAAGSLLVEIGTDANTLSEALYSGRLLGKQLAALMT